MISGLGFGVWGLGFSVVFGFRFRFREGADIGQNIEWRRLGLAHRPAAKRGHATQEAFARLAGNRSGESISPSQVAGTPQSPLRFHSLPRESALGGQRLVCMLGRDRERDHACRPRERNTRTCNTHSRAENTWGIGTMSCHSGREEYATHGIRSPSLPSGGVTRAGP